LEEAAEVLRDLLVLQLREEAAEEAEAEVFLLAFTAIGTQQ
jgi:hypothetical protein